jgi:hypothetical protein
MTRKEQLQRAAATLGVPVYQLDALITAESNHKTTARNPHTGAVGLLQWLDPRARDLGYKDKEDLYNNNKTYEQQLNLIVRDLSRYRPFKNQQELYLSVFYPAWRKKSPLTQFPDSVQRVNPGIRTVGDYVKFVESQYNKKKAKKATPYILTLAGLALFAVLKSPKKKRKK